MTDDRTTARGSASVALPGREERRVRSMFDGIAARYDGMNTVMTAGLHHRWRRKAVDRLWMNPTSKVLDVCCGTGDLTFAVERELEHASGGRVVGTDFSPEMLRHARRKAHNRGSKVEFVEADTLDLPFDSGEFDAVTAGFGVRNLSDLGAGLGEMVRVTRRGGRVAILEIAAPTPPLSKFFAVWFDRIVPSLGSAVGRSDAYSYLPWSVRTFPEPAVLASLMRDVGIRDVHFDRMAGGIVALHHGVVGE